MNIVLADDHALFRGGLALVLKQLADDVTISEAATAQETLKCVRDAGTIDLILLDLKLPDASGFKILEQLKQEKPEAHIVIISASEDAADIQRAVQLGAAGYISKHSNQDILLSALRIVLAGEHYFPRTAGNTAAVDTGLLTPRQLDVLKRMDEGLSNKVIASELSISEATVKMHVTAIFKALGASNRTMAVLKAQKLGLLNAH